MKRILITACGLLFSGLALAAGSATYQVGGADGQASLDYAWRNGAVQMRMGQQPGYMLVRDGEVYAVTQANGKPRVMAMSGMMRPLQGAAPQTMADAQVESFSLNPTGRSETVAGLTGEVYTGRIVFADGSRGNGQLVLSDDPLAAELTRAQASVGASFMDRDNPMTQQFLAGGRGLLRFSDDRGNSMRLSRISRDAPPASAFELPAQPMQMPNLGNQGEAASGGTSAQAGADAEGDGGGFFGGLFGGAGDTAAGKAERQQKRQAGNVERRVDQETDSAVDKAVDGFMDSLFGN